MPAGHPKRARFLNSLGIQFRDRFQRTGQMADLDQAIQYGQQAIEATPTDHPERATYLNSLGVRFGSRFERTGKMADLERAIQYGQQAVEAAPVDHPERSIYLDNLGTGFRDRFQRTGQMTDLEQAIQCSRQAIEAISAKILNSLGVQFRCRFHSIGRMGDLKQAIQYSYEAIEITSANHPERATYLTNIGAQFGDRFHRTGEMTDLEQGIQYSRQAVEAAPADHPERALYLNNLGVQFRDRFERTGRMADLEQSIQYGQQAIEAAPADHPERATFLNSLGVRFGSQFERTSQIVDLERAIQHSQQAIEATPADHSNRATYLNSLGVRFGNRFERTGEMADLERAIQCGQQAVEAAPVDHPGRAMYSNNLGIGFGDRFQRTGQMADLEQSIKYGQQAVEAAPADHPNRATYLINLGNALGDRFQRTGEVVDLRSSIEASRKAFSCSSSSPLVRITAGHSVVLNLARGENWKEAADTLMEILRLLPEVTPPINSRNDLQHTLRQLYGLASLSASVFLKVGKPSVEALQALESGRGMIASLMIDARSDVPELKVRYPELWSRYTQCREQIAALSTENTRTLQVDWQQSYAAKSDRRQQLFKNVNDLRNEIRRCPGFERFLLPLTEKEIRDLSRNGPIVCFNISNISSEAFLVTMTSIQALPLPDLKPEDIKDCVRLFALRGNLARRDVSVCESDEDEQPFPSDMLARLRALWNNAVKPALQQLGLFSQGKPPDKLPRIWWVGGGMTALLPLHAAGDHTPGSTENTLDNVISSFAPTLKMLQFIQNKPQVSISRRTTEILVVSMPTTPGGYKPLNVAEEVAAIANHTRSWASTTPLERPSKVDVLNALKTCSIAHFACHGFADPIEPAKSALILGREAEERLTLEDLDAVVHDRAQIAYLSACSTAEIQAVNLVDESVHLASTFQLAGFQHVIGTLWGADDNAAVEIASKFYEGLLRYNEDDGTSVAQALHDALLCFRNVNGNHTAVSKWAPFIHLGC